MNREALKDIFQNSLPEAAYAAAYPQWSTALSRLPVDARDSVVRYVLFGSDGGSFLTKLVENDLFGVMGRADLENRARLFDYVNFFYNFAPSECWGSKEAVRAWMAKGGAFPRERGEAL